MDPQDTPRNAPSASPTGEADAARLLRAIFHAADPGAFFTVWTLPDKATRPFRVADADQAARYAVGRTAANVYYSPGLQQAAPARGRGRSADVVALPAVWLDVDHVDADQAREIAHRFPLPPSAIVNTGGGAHPYWILEHPATRDEAGRFAILDAWRDAWRILAADLEPGTVDFATLEPARVLRVPGTTNGKYTPPRPVDLAELADGRTYTEDDMIAAALAIVGSQPPPGSVRSSPAHIAPTDGPIAAYVANAVNGELDRVLAAQPGARNHPLNAAAFAIGQLLSAPWSAPYLEHDDAAGRLQAAADTSGYADGSQAAAAVIRDGIAAGIDNPRQEPDWRAPHSRDQARRSPDRTPLAADDQVLPHCTPGLYTLDDIGNGERLAALYGDQLRHCAAESRWLVWTGTHWQRDNRNDVQRCAIQTARSIFYEAADAEDDKDREAIGAHAAKVQNIHRREAMVKDARHLVAVVPSEMDADPYTLNVLNGTVDLRTGELHAHDPADLITLCAPVPYDRDADLADTPGAAMWRTFINTATAGDASLSAYLARAFGLTVIGEPRDNVLFVAYGLPATAKSTMLDAVAGVIGPYAEKADSNLFLQSRSADSANAASPAVYDLRGKRMVYAAEPARFRRLATALINELSGDATLTARPLYGHRVTFPRSFTLILAGNHRPEIPEGSTDGIWRRLRELPFLHVIPERDRIPGYSTRLINEAGPAILAWLARGARSYLAEQLGTCPAVDRATAAYRAECDPLSDWLETSCVLEPDARETAKKLHDSYAAHCQEAGETPISTRELADHLRGRGCQQTRTKAGRYWTGVRLYAPLIDGPRSTADATNGDG